MFELPDDNRPRSFEDWDEWEAQMRKDYPIKYFLAETLPHFWRFKIIQKISDAIWWLKYHFIPKHKYHLIDIRQPKEWNEIHGLGYRYGFIDRDHALLLAHMQIMLDFVKKEMDGEQGLIDHIEFLKSEKEKDPNENCFNWDERIKNWQELHNIFNWWRFGRHNDYLMLDRNFSPEEEERLFKKDTEMMKRLADIRGIMWT